MGAEDLGRAGHWDHNSGQAQLAAVLTKERKSVYGSKTIHGNALEETEEI